MSKERKGVGRSKGRKMGLKMVLSMPEEKELVDYIYLMLDWDYQMTPIQLKNKVVEIVQERITLFKDGVFGESWIRWFRTRHPDLVLRVPQGLDHKKARALNLEKVAKFYTSFDALYLQHNYPPYCI